ncbi:MAG: hypothetical protein LBG47_05720 [Prevotellaceae bacterium]|nr:hypothetical protein [Prevotellaceae bacterium]
MEEETSAFSSNATAPRAQPAQEASGSDTVAHPEMKSAALFAGMLG